MSEIDYELVNCEEVTVFILDNVRCVVLSENTEYINSLRTFFTDKVPNYQFMPAYRSGNWSGDIKHLSFDGTLPLGLLCELKTKCEEWDIPISIQGKTSSGVNIDLFDSVIENELIKNQEKPMYPWVHQVDIAKVLIKEGRGIARAATSAGKTYTMAMMCKYLQYTGNAKKILIIVPRTDLVVQGVRDAVSYGYDENELGMFFGSIKDSDKPITFSTWQSLQHIEDDTFFEQFDCIFGDEIHLVNNSAKTKSGAKTGGNVFKRCIDKCKNAKYRFGLTGTMPKDRLTQRTIKGCLGEILIEVTADELMKKKHVADLSVVLCMLKYKDIKTVNEKIKEIRKELPEDSITAGYIAEKTFIESYVPRYRFIAKLVNKCQQNNENVLVLASTVEYGKKLKKVIEHKCKKSSVVFHIHGEMPVKERQKIITEAEQMENVVIVATTSLFSTGISIKRLHSVILGAGATGKSRVSLLQSVGRILRQHSTKTKAKVFDLIDSGLKYSEQHGSLRVEYYDSENFDANIVEIEI